MGRHTTIGKSGITRSFGVDEDGDDAVVELTAAGEIIVRREPAHRKKKRNEKFPEVRMDVHEMVKDLSTPTVEAKENDLVSILEAVAAKVPIAKFEGKDPKYEMKVWLIQTLKQTIKDNS